VRVTAAEQTQTALLNKWVDEQKAAVRSATARKLTVDVMKPATVQPGAPNDFLLVVKDERERWEARGKLVAEVRAVGATDAVLLSQEIDHKQGDRHALRLPADVWARVKPNTELFLVVAQVDELTKTRTELQDRVRLAGPVFTTLLVTDKPAYRPGERLFFRSLTLDRVTLRPPTREQILKYELFRPDGRPVSGLSATGTTELVRVGPEGKVEPVRAADGQPVRGVGCAEFVLPADLADGDYLLALREQPHPGGFPATVPVPATRLVKVRAGATDAYRKEIGFAREGYAPGEAVEAWAELKFEGKPVSGAAVAGVAVEADGVAVKGVTTTKATGPDGRVRVNFPLPPDVADGDVRLRVTFRTPGGEEAVAERVPVVGRRLVVEFFPECGETLVAGVPCKVYVRTTTPAGQPVPIRGVVTDGRRTLAKVESLNDPAQPGANRGLASFTYTPALGTRVWLKLESPAGSFAPIMTEATIPSAAVALLGGPGAVAARSGFPLPLPQRDGVVMSVPDAVTAPGQPIRVRLHSVGSTRTIVVGAYTRGRLSDTQKVTVEPGQVSEVRLMAGADPGTGGRGGVVRITAFEELEGKEGEAKPDLRPVAERLVFRKPGELLNLALTTTPAANETQAATGVQTLPVAPQFGYTAGAAVNLNITATDENGNPAAAILWAAAVNSGVAPGAKDRLLPTHFLLAGEVKDPDELEYADFLLTDHPKAAEALDLVLGTQGWRRFVEQSPAVVPAAKPGAFVANFPGADVNHLLAHNGQYPVWAEPAPVRDHRKLYETYAPRYEAAVQAVARAKAELTATRADTSDEAAARELGGSAAAARHAAEEKARRAEAAREPVLTFRANVWYGIAGFAALALCCALVSFARPAGRFPLGFSAVGSLGLALFLVVAAGWSDKAQAAAIEQSAREIASGPRAAKEKEAAQPVAPAGGGQNDAKSEAVVAAGNKADTFTGLPEAKSGVKSAPKGGVGSGPPAPGTMNFGPATNPVRPTAPFPPPRIPADGFAKPPPGGYGAGGMMGLGPYAPALAPPKPSGLGATPPAPAPLPGAPMIELSMGGGKGWTPHRSKVLLSEPGRSALRSSGDVFFAEALKKDSEQAAKYAADRARVLTAAMDDVLDRRTRLHPAPSPPVMAVQAPHLPKFTPADVEKLAVQRVRGAVTVTPPLVVREYAAARPSPAPMPGEADSPDTVLWQPVIVLPADGKATLTFHLGDAPGGYQLVVAGHTADGRLGAARDIVRVAPKTLAPGGQGVPGGSVPPVVPVAPGPRPMP
jgi:hypothetical protein